MSNTYEVYAVFHTEYGSYVSNEGYHYQMASLEYFKHNSLDKAMECVNFLVERGLCKPDYLVIHKLNLVVSQTINVKPNAEKR